MIDRTKILAGLPVGLRDALFKTYLEIAANYLEHRWEPSELNGGNFCEVIYTIIDGSIRGVLAAKPSKPNDMVKACRALEILPANSKRVGDRSFRILIPRMLPALYEIRNNRGVGHVGGDVDPNFLDATAVYGMASWVLAELVRIFHNVSTEEAQETVDALVERKVPLVWELDDLKVKRVLAPSMSNHDQTLILLNRSLGWISDKELLTWVEYSNLTMYRKRVLGPLHKARLIEFDRKQGRARISPLGVKQVEQEILNSRSSCVVGS